jgi:protein-tyrosine phosphatase
MEKEHKLRITENFSDYLYEKEIITLFIPDDYQYMDEELIEEITSKVSDYL